MNIHPLPPIIGLATALTKPDNENNTVSTETVYFTEVKHHVFIINIICVLIFNENKNLVKKANLFLRKMQKFGNKFLPYFYTLRSLKRLKVIFIPDDDKCYLPTSSACTKTLRLPKVHSSHGNFFQSMHIALKYGKVGFPNS